MGILNFTIHWYEQLASTQQFLAERLNNETLEEGSLIITSSQTAGKGQENNHWVSDPGKNLTFSFLLRPSFLEPSAQFMLTKMISLSVWRCLQKIKGIPSPVSIKWPNDLYAGNKKIAGILISNRIMGNSLEASIIGIGLNINQSEFPKDCPNPTSLYLETGHEQDPAHVLDLLLESISCHYHLLQTEADTLNEKYLGVLYQARELKPYIIHGRTLEASISGVNEYGKLQLEIPEEGIVECDMKEIIYL